MKYMFLPILSLAIIFNACTDNSTGGIDLEKNPDKVIENEFSEATLKRHIEGSLSIPATENYSYEIFTANLDGDDSLDMVVTVNQLSKALDEAIQSGNVAKRAEMGYMGRFNHFFYVDGMTKKISPAIPVASSPHGKLTISFAHIRSDAFNDFVVDYRIRNSKFRRFFTVINGVPRQVFETKIFDGLGTENTEAYVIKYEQGSFSLAKDILVYEGKLEDVVIDNPMDVYNVYPKITETEILDRKWFFNDQSLKYYTETD